MIAKDLGLKPFEVANSNIIALTATLVVRLIAGPMCDRVGPRYTFAGLLLLGAIPTFLAGTVKSASGLMALRFFVGILGGTFVPCQVWTTGFYDKNIVGTANALVGGIGNAGGGITYFAMPAIFDSLVARGLTPHVAWRVTFVVPGILIVSAAVLMILLCDDTPTGKWSEREQVISQASHEGAIVNVPGARSDSDSPTGSEKDIKVSDNKHANEDAQVGDSHIIEEARGEVIQKPTLKEIVKVCFSLQVLVCGACYFATFGGELAINSILGSYYTKNFPKLGFQQTGNWAAMFGMLNAIFRPLGGAVADVVYGKTKNVWSKRVLLHTYVTIAGAFLIIIGKLDPKNTSTMFGLIAGMAFFLEGANGLNFAYVPHVHPYANGVVSGFTGACGNLGGIVFALIFRFNLTPKGTQDYPKAIWIIGILVIAVNLAFSWVKPIPKGQIGGH